jgi:hypothetical protein
MTKVLLSFLLFSLTAQASSGLNQFLVFEKCDSGNCQELRESFHDNTFSLKENPLSEAEIEELKVVENKSLKTYSIEIKLKSALKSTIENNVIVYRHQVLSKELEQHNDGTITAKIEFKKNTPLKKINKYCLNLNKSCKWMSELNRF